MSRGEMRKNGNHNFSNANRLITFGFRSKVIPHECVVQLVEQLTFNQWVGGSSPLTLTTNSLFPPFFWSHRFTSPVRLFLLVKIYKNPNENLFILPIDKLAEVWYNCRAGLGRKCANFRYNLPL